MRSSCLKVVGLANYDQTRELAVETNRSSVHGIHTIYVPSQSQLSARSCALFLIYKKVMIILLIGIDALNDQGAKHNLNILI